MNATAHIVLRDRRDWYGSTTGLTLDRDGNLQLARVPAPTNQRSVEIAAAYPYLREASGIAVGPGGALFVADTANNRVLYVDAACQSQTAVTPGQYPGPRGLACSAEDLLICDTGNSRVQSLAFPRLEPHAAWSDWLAPTAIAVDAQDQAIVVDIALRRVYRTTAAGRSDPAFDTTLVNQGKLQNPFTVACTADDRLIVSDTQLDSVFVFDTTGTYVGMLPGPAGWQPGAMTCCENRAFVADARNGKIWVFELAGAQAQLVGPVNGWTGPVSALAADRSGALYIKPGLDATYYHFSADQAFIGSGSLLAGPYDAGEAQVWERAWLDAQIPANAAVTFSIVAKADSAAPAAADWVELPSTDALLAEFFSLDTRYIWLRANISTTDAQVSPLLQQVRAATATEDLRDYLPLTYRRNEDQATGFLARWLKLIRGEYGRIEEALADMPRVGDPAFEIATALPWLAEWLALELPRIATDAERRELLQRVASLYARRGTRDSIAEFVKLHTGIKPTIVEAFADRRLWILGTGLGLDFDTRLAELDPLGMVLPEETAGDGCCPPEATNSAVNCCSPSAALPESIPVSTPIGRAIVGESGPLTVSQIGLPLYSEDAYRFCVLIDAYRANSGAIRAEIARIVEREKPAHTDYRIEYLKPETRIGLQCRIGIDAIVGGDPPALRLSPAQLGVDTQLPPPDVARIGSATVDGLLTLN